MANPNQTRTLFLAKAAAALSELGSLYQRHPSPEYSGQRGPWRCHYITVRFSEDCICLQQPRSLLGTLRLGDHCILSIVVISTSWPLVLDPARYLTCPVKAKIYPNSGRWWPLRDCSRVGRITETQRAVECGDVPTANGNRRVIKALSPVGHIFLLKFFRQTLFLKLTD
jgi:hypothetical protein